MNQELHAAARFWSKVNVSWGASPCWLWRGKKDVYGYGAFFINNREWKAHRFAYLIAHGCEALESAPLVRHLCHNPLCCNPDHLALGDRRDNAADDEAAGRVTFGAKRWSSTLSDEAVDAIRTEPLSAAKAAAKWGCSVSYVYQLRRTKGRRTERRRSPDFQKSAVGAMEGR